jgi:hypothetical protein
MPSNSLSLPVAQQISLPGHFSGPVILEAARPLTSGFECRVRLPDGSLEEAIISEQACAREAGLSARRSA